MTENGLITQDGQQIDLDILICATGYDSSCHPGIPIIGKGGVDLKDKYSPYPKTYLSMAVDGFPNLFWGLGPNSGVNSGSLLVLMERQVDYAVAATLKMQRERIACMQVKRKAVDAWREYMKGFFPKVCPTSSL